MHTKSHKLSCNWKFAWKLLKICLILANRMETNTARAHTLNSHHLLCHRTFSVCVSSENYNNASECALCLLAAVAYSERCLRDTFFSLWFARASISFQYFRVDIALIISRFAFNLVSFNTLRMRKLEKMNFTWKNEERKNDWMLVMRMKSSLEMIHKSNTLFIIFNRLHFFQIYIWKLIRRTMFRS